MLKRLLILVQLTAILANYSFGDIPQTGSETSPQTFNSWNGYILPPKGEYRLLVIYINIIYDAAVSDPVAGNEIWPQAQIEGINVDMASWPVYLNTLFDAHYSPANQQGMFTQLFAESSFDSLIVTADHMIVNIRHSSISGGGTFGHFALIDTVSHLINQQGGLNTIHGHNSIADYAKIDSTKFDCVKFIFRNSTPGYGFFGTGNGTAGAGDWVNLKTSEGKYYSAFSATIQCVGNSDISKNPTNVAVHEFSHLLFGGTSFHTSGGHSWGGRMCFMGIQYGYGLMGGASSGLVNCNGYERYRVGWMSAENTSGWPITASGVISDISRNDGKQSFILRDFITTGDVVRIKLPHLQAPASNQYIWLENHKLKEDKLNFLQYSNTHPHCRPQAQKGIYAYYQVGKDTLTGSRSSVYPVHDTDNLRIICANGFFDQEYRGTIPGDCINSAPFSYFADIAPNPLAGNNDLSAYFIDIPGLDVLKPGINAKNAMAKTYYHSPADTVKNLPYLMSDINAFSGFAELSLNTNPAPFNTPTYYHGPVIEDGVWITRPRDVFRNQPEVYLSGLKIEMWPLENDDYQIDISWDNYELTSSVRWTGRIVLKEKLFINPGATLSLEQNLTPATINRDPATGLFAPHTQLRCAEGSLMVQHTNSQVKLDEMSILLLEAGSHYLAEGGLLSTLNGSTLAVASDGVFEQRSEAITEISNTGTLLIEQGGHYIIDGGLTVIKPGGRIEIESCATLEIRNGGLLSIESLAQICIHPGAFIVIDSIQNLQFAFGYNTGDCLWFTPANFEELVIARPPAYSITENVGWNNVIYNFTDDLRIDPAAALTLSGGSELRFAPGKKIIVERGATLNISDSKITNLCSGVSWSGIEVWGDVSQSQLLTEHQGVVNISGRSIVEHAVTGILAGKSFSQNQGDEMVMIDPEFSGGIVHATSSSFLNNRTGIFLAPFENRMQRYGPAMGNLSLIEDCEFLSNSNLFDKSDFIKLAGVRGVEIRGNTFKRSSDSKAETTGILSLNSAFFVEPYCPDGQTPCPDPKPNQFENLKYGIRALGTGSEKTFTIDSAHFTNNVIGVYTNANNNFSVLRSVFRVKGLSSQQPQKGGIYVEGPAMGFRISGNRFTGVYAGVDLGTGTSFGATFNNTGSYNNLISNNWFDSLHVAVHAMNHNRSNKGFSGLGVYCNDFGLVRHAIMAIGDTASMGRKGIAAYQGSVDAAAANKFSSSDLWEAHIYNHGAPMIYFYPAPSASGSFYEPQKITPDSVSLFPAEQLFDCEAFPGNLSEPDFEALWNVYQHANNQVQTKRSEYQKRIDGGNTKALLNRISLSHPSEATELLNLLLKNSPWLTDSALIAAIQLEHVLPEIMVRDILAANPQSSRSRKILYALYGRFPRLPDQISEVMELNQSRLSAKETFEADLLQSKMMKNQFLVQLMKYLMNTREGAVLSDQIEELLAQQNSPAWHYVASMMLVEQGNIFDASGVLYKVLYQFDLSEEYLLAHNALRSMVEKMYFLSLEGKTLWVPDSATIQWLFEINNLGYEPAAMWAGNILKASGMAYLDPHFLYPVKVEPPPVRPPSWDEEPPRLEVMKIFPNPAMSYFIVDHDVSHLPELQNESLYITIYNVNGKHIETIQLEGLANQKLIYTNNYSPGVYMLNFHYGSRVIESLRLIIF